MTAQEAITFLKETLAGCHFLRDRQLSQVCRLSISALEKQIPKKVIPFKRTAHDFQSNICKHSGYPCEHIKTFNNEYQFTDYRCPNCKKRVSDGTPKFCDKCGQALDWSDTE